MNNKIWNHNYAYHNWILKNIKNDSTILDVGCGDGTLAFKLANNKMIVGIDTNEESIKKANQLNKNNNINFINDDYLKHEFDLKFDYIIFVASIHHMNMEKALQKAKTLLNENGEIIIVGLAKPSTIVDHLIEAFRIIPSFIISKIKNNKTSEELNITTSYNLPKMNDVRSTIKKVLGNNYKLRPALHYRYLLTWNKKARY